MSFKKAPYRLGLDLGTNSLGWCLVSLNQDNQPTGLIRMGVRLFRDGRTPKEKQSLAVDRRIARGMRRRRDRWLKRQAAFLSALTEYGLFPKSIEERRALAVLDPYVIRAKALDYQVSLYEIGRALFHLNQRRGFKSNRKLDNANKKEDGKINSAIKTTQSQLGNCRTVGEWLAQRHDCKEPHRQSVRARLFGTGKLAAYDLYISRDMIINEFDILWKAQKVYYPSILSEEKFDNLKKILANQRPLKPVKAGRCIFEETEEKIPNALPSAQRFRIYQELNNIRYSTGLGVNNNLSIEQRNLLADLLEGKLNSKGKIELTNGKLTFDKMRKILKLSPENIFNLEDQKRDGLKGNTTSLSLSKEGSFGGNWHQLPLAEQDNIVHFLLTEESEETIINFLQKNYELSLESASKIANTGFTDGHCQLGKTALAKILPYLMDSVVHYDKAVVAAGYNSHSQFHTGEIFSKALPYYGELLTGQVGFGTGNSQDADEKRYGKIANPTVHIGLNQIRRLVNAILKKYGSPTQIVIEVTRDLKQSQAKRLEIMGEQKKLQDLNKQYSQEVREQRNMDNFAAVSGEDILKIKLWRELGNSPTERLCPYTGKRISRDILLSDQIEIEHILPFSKTLDDSIANKTVCFTQANRQKANQTPYEAFGHHSEQWQEIKARAELMPANKRWRFSDHAMSDFQEKYGNDFEARQLNDTAYLSRVAKAYLSYVCEPHQVYTSPGRLTALLRGKWKLNKLVGQGDNKDRNDQRHHALDAVVIAVTDRWLLQVISRLSAQEKLVHGKSRIMVPLPWASFIDDLTKAIPNIVPSYKPDHGTEAGLHNDTAYGFAETYDPDKPSDVVHRKPISYFKNIEHIGKIRDEFLRKELTSLLENLSEKLFIEKLNQWSEQKKIRHLRIIEKISVIPIYRRTSRFNEVVDQPYKAYKGDGNYCIEIYRGSKEKWEDSVITSFEAAQIFKNTPEKLKDRNLAQNGFSLVMRLCIDDIVALEEDTDRRLYRVVGLSDGRVTLAGINEAGDLRARSKSKEDGFSYMVKSGSALQKCKARQVFVNELGFVLDSGFKN